MVWRRVQPTKSAPNGETSDETVVSADVNMVFFLPDEFRSPQPSQEAVAELSLGPAAIIFEKPINKTYHHLKPLYLEGYINGKPINMMMVDTGAAVNLMPYAVCRKIGHAEEDLIKTNVVLNDFKGNQTPAKGVLNVDLTIGHKTVSTSFFVVDSDGHYLALLGRDWIHANCYVPSTMHQCLIQWNGDEVEVVPTDDSCDITMAEAPSWWGEGTECLTRRKEQDWSFVTQSKKWGVAGSGNRRPILGTSILDRAHPSDRPLIKEISCKADLRNRHFNETKSADACHRPFYYFESHMICTTELAEDGKLGCGFTPADDLEEIDIGPGDRPRPTYISKKLGIEAKVQFTSLLREFADCFTWEYHEMSGLDRSIVEHRLPIKPGFCPFAQAPRKYNTLILGEIKAEIQKMTEAGFIRPCRYATWISSIIPVRTKNGQLHVCIDFRDLNRATPKDEYPMPVADLLIDAIAGHKMMSFLDGNAGYNQILMAEEDIFKTAFGCPGNIGLFEWVVMTFGLKNARATYQRAMNYIFHYLIGQLIEVYIDDVLVKSALPETHLADLRQVLERTCLHGLRMNPKKCAFGVSRTIPGFHGARAWH